MSIAALPLPMRRRPNAEGVRWGASFAVALGLHALAALLFLAWRVPFAPPAMPPAAIMIDLAPIPTPVAAPAPVIEPEKPAPQIVPGESPPPPTPVERPVQQKPTPRPTAKMRTQPPAAMPQAAPAPVAAAPAPQAQPAPEARPNAMASFEALLAAHLDRYKRYPHASQVKGEQGEALLRFTMDRQGHVLAARLERGSGYAALDEEIMAMIRRAEPLPPLPPEVAGQRLELVVPIRFRLR